MNAIYEDFVGLIVSLIEREVDIYRKMVIYKWTNNVNGKTYVGKTLKSLKNRLTLYKHNVKQAKEGTFKRNSPIIYAIAKHGCNNFTLSIIDVANSNEELCKKEEFWVAYFKCQDVGYNVLPGGKDNSGKNSPAFGKKRPGLGEYLSKLFKGKKKPPRDPNAPPIKRKIKLQDPINPNPKFIWNRGKSKFSVETKQEIIKKHNAGMTCEELGIEYGCSKTHISRITRGKSH